MWIEIHRDELLAANALTILKIYLAYIITAFMIYQKKLTKQGYLQILFRNIDAFIKRLTLEMEHYA